MGLLQSFLNLEATAGNIATAMTIVTLIALAGRIINMQYLHPLSKFPGPWWATSFSISLALISVLGMEHHFLLRLYKKYGNGAYKGPIRISPTMLLFPHPSALREIYRDPRLNTKTGVYGSGTIGTPESLFEIIDGEEHKALRKALSNAPWTIGQLKNQWEPRFDAHILLFLEKMREHASANRVICLSDKVAEFSADILSMISFGEAFGCVKNQRDEKRIVENWRKGLYAFGFVTRWRFLRDVIIPRTALGKWLLPKAAEEDGMGWLMKEADRQVTERERMATEKGGCEGQKDFLQHCLEARLPNDAPLSPSQKRAHVTLLIQAGTDTTGTALGSTLRFLLQRPSSLQRCLDEIRAADIANRLSNPIQFEETRQHLPYFAACIKESLRLHSPAPNIFARLCPPEGKTINGVFVPPGAEIAMHAYTIHRNRDFWGEDAEEFRPERWFEGEPERTKEMDAGLFHFGYGFRVCIGKDIATMELYKLLPEFLRRFDLELVEPGKFIVVGGIAWNEGVLGKLKEREGWGEA